MADSLSHKIRQARKEAGLTRERMAPMIGVTLRTLVRYETGETQRISVNALVQIAEATGKPLSFFFEEVAA